MNKPRQHIRTPWKVQLGRFARTGLPIIVFLGTSVVTLWIWDQRGAVGSAMGRVEAQRVNVTAGTDGVLASLPALQSSYVKPYDRVQAGQIVARLDDQPLQSLLLALQGDLAALHKQLDSTRAETRLTDSERQHEYMRQATELASDVERCRLDVLDRNSQLQEAQVELSRLDAQLEYLQLAESKGLLIGGEVTKAVRERDAMVRVASAHSLAVRQARENFYEARKRLESQPQLQPAELDDLLAPIRASIGAAEARVGEVEAQIANLTIRSPIDGVVSAVYYHPGQGVRAGEWIMTIAAERSEHIVAYVPPDSLIEPETGMEATVRARSSRSRIFQATVERVASQWEPIPLELLRDQNIPQIALAVRLTIPEQVDLRPGELVEVKFRRRNLQ